MNPTEKMRAALAAAKAIASTAEAENRDLTDAEIAEAAAHMKAYDEAKKELAKHQAADAVKKQLADIGINLGLEDYDGDTKRPPLAKLGSRSQWASKSADAIRDMYEKNRLPNGAKALFTGSVPTEPLIGEPVTIDTPPTSLLDLIAHGQPLGTREGNQFQYVRQTARVNNAAAVPDLADKPQSTYTFGEVEDHYRVYANKTEPLPIRYLDDHKTIIEIVQAQLEDDTLLAIEADVLNGDGTDDAFTGILQTSGIQSQAFTTDKLTTLSNAKYKLIGQELPFNGWVMNPADVQSLENLRENGATGAFLFKSRAEIEAYLGAPIVPSVGIAAGLALLGDFRQAEITPLGDDNLTVDMGKKTENNTMVMMYEGRYGFRLKKPVAFVSVDLTA
jgi:HK97 family phage major capsid protein